MRDDNARSFFWPPDGWTDFEFIEDLSGQSVSKDPASGQVKGLIYQITSKPTYYNDDIFLVVHEIKIAQWKYNFSGDHQEYPLISFFLQDRKNDKIEKKRCIFQIKIKDKIFPVTAQSAQRVCMASILLIKQINMGVTSDFDRVLKMYKIHPSQRKIYQLKNFARNEFYCKRNVLFQDKDFQENCH